MKKNNGFTLIELLVVIFIMAIFAGVAVSSIFSVANTSKIKIDKNKCIELQQIVTDAVKSDSFVLSANHSKIGFITWNYSVDTSNPDNKTILRNLIIRELGTTKVPVPRQNGYAFFVYLLPPYTVTCLPVSDVTKIDTTNFNLSNLTDEFLLNNYPKAKYPQMYVSTYTESPAINPTTGSISDAVLAKPTFLKPGTTPSSTILNTYVGCINIPSDYT